MRRYLNISEKWGDRVEVTPADYIAQAKNFEVPLNLTECQDGLYIDGELVAEPIPAQNCAECGDDMPVGSDTICKACADHIHKHGLSSPGRHGGIVEGRVGRKCDACGGVVVGGIGIGGTLLCRTCSPIVEEECAELRAAGKTVNAPKIAAKIRREKMHAYILRDIPPALWEQVQGAAARSGITARKLIMDAIVKDL